MIKNPIAISVRQATKSYRRPLGGLTLRGALAGLLGRRARGVNRNELHALQDVTFDIQAGEGFGLIGSNGAGKSTMLKVIGGITGYTSGSVEVNGSLASLIEVGAGFHPDLTGRENIHLNASMMGLSRRRIEELLNDIIAFADLGEYIEMPVRTYSSGMVVRLGFAVAIHVQPDILLIDEVLSVGDMAFQARSFERIQAERRRGTTIVFVSHSLPAVSAVCDRVAWIDHGRLRMLGPAAEVIGAYQDDQERQIKESLLQAESDSLGTGELILDGVELIDAQGRESDVFEFNSPMTVRLSYHALARLAKPYFIIAVVRQGVPLFAGNMLIDGQQPEWLEGRGILECSFAGLPLLPGVYEISLQVRANPASNYINYRIVKRFSITSSFEQYGLNGDFTDTVGRHTAPIYVPYHWHHRVQANDGKVKEDSTCLGVSGLA